MANSLVALLIPGLSIHSVAWYLPSIGDVLADLLRVAIPLAPLIVRLRWKTHSVLLRNGRTSSGCTVSKHGWHCVQGELDTHLWHLHLLDGADHVGRFLAPVTLDDVAFDGRAIDRYDGVSGSFVGVKPERREENLNSLYIIPQTEVRVRQINNEHRVNVKTHLTNE